MLLIRCFYIYVNLYFYDENLNGIKIVVNAIPNGVANEQYPVNVCNDATKSIKITDSFSSFYLYEK